MRHITKIDGFAGYGVTRDGKVWSQLKTPSQHPAPWRMLKPEITKQGYCRVSLYKNEKPHRMFVHVLVLSVFIGPRPKGFCTRHLNGNPSDNRIVNLQWGSYKENCADKVLHGRHICGSKSPLARLREREVKAIRAMVSSGTDKKQIAKQFGVSLSGIWHICKRRTWNHI